MGFDISIISDFVYLHKKQHLYVVETSFSIFRIVTFYFFL